MNIPEIRIDPTELEWPEPWEPIVGERAENCTRELFRELPHGHVLHGVRCIAVGCGRQPDDILFQVQRSDAKFAFVHLTWSAETNPEWPFTVLFRSFEDFLANEKSESESGPRE